MHDLFLLLIFLVRHSLHNISASQKKKNTFFAFLLTFFISSIRCIGITFFFSYYSSSFFSIHLLYQSVLFLKPSQYYHINVNSSIILFISLDAVLFCSNVAYCYGNNSSAQVVFCISGDSFFFFSWQLFVFFFYLTTIRFFFCSIFSLRNVLLFNFGSINTTF